MKKWILILLLCGGSGLLINDYVNAKSEAARAKELVTARGKELEKYKSEQVALLATKDGQIMEVTQKLADVVSEKELLSSDLARAVSRADNTARVNANLRLSLNEANSKAIGNVTVVEDSTSTVYNVDLDFKGIKFTVALKVPEGTAQGVITEFPPLDVNVVMTEEVTGDWLASGTVSNPLFNIESIDVKVNPHTTDDGWLMRSLKAVNPGIFTAVSRDGTMFGPAFSVGRVDVGLDALSKGGTITFNFFRK